MSARGIAVEGLRSLRIGEQSIPYELHRSRRRTIGFSIDRHGLRVTAPIGLAQARIDAALQTRGDWVLRKLDEWRMRAEQAQTQAIRWTHGGTLPFLGEALILEVLDGPRALTRREADVLRIALRAPTPETVRASAERWLMAQARSLFAARLTHFHGLHGLAPQRWALSSARTRWGSCSATGTIRLNWRLMHFPPDIIDYVICHELAHLREMNHSARFWQVVAGMYPDYARARRWLRSLDASVT